MPARLLLSRDRLFVRALGGAGLWVPVMDGCAQSCCSHEGNGSTCESSVKIHPRQRVNACCSDVYLHSIACLDRADADRAHPLV